MKLSEIAKHIATYHPDSELRYYINDKNVDEELLIEPLLDFYIHEQMDLCKCGRPEDTYETIRTFLLIRKAWEKNGWSRDNVVKSYEANLHINYKNDINYGLLQFLMYVLDSYEFIEHGSSISGCWLTKDGERLLTVLNAWHKHLEE